MHCPCTCPADLTGTIPLSIRELTNLRHVFLSFNKLRGSLNGRFCTRRSDPLEVLILRANFFAGPVNMTGCHKLLLLDLTVGLQIPLATCSMGTGSMVPGLVCSPLHAAGTAHCFSKGIVRARPTCPAKQQHPVASQ